MKVIAHILLLLSLVACLPELSRVEVSGLRRTSVLNAQIQDNQLFITGSNMDKVTEVYISGEDGFKESFAIEAKSKDGLIAKSIKEVGLAVGGVFRLVIADAHGATSFPINLTVKDGSITAAKLSDMGANNGDVLIYNNSTLKWEPRPLIDELNLQGTWNANTNSPILADGGGSTFPTLGDYYIVSDAGPTSIDGLTNWVAGDWILFDGTAWTYIANSSTITSFNGRQGAVTPAANDYTWNQIDKTTSTINGIADVDTTTAAPAAGDVLGWDGTNWIPSIPVSNASSNTTNNIITADANSDTTGEIIFKTGTTTHMTIDNAGNIGIGISTPAEKLDVVGNIKASGDICSSSGTYCLNTIGAAAGDITDVVAGTGLTGGATSAAATLNVNVDNATIEVVTDTVQVKNLGITNAKIATGVDAAKINTGVISNTEFNYLNGATSNIQTQLNSKGDITGVTAGTGLSGGGTSGTPTISANTTYLQRRVSSSCAAGSSIRAIAANGTVTCEAGGSGGGPIWSISRGSNVAMSTGVWTKIVMSSEEYDPDNIVSSGVVTPNKPGYYLMTASLRYLGFGEYQSYSVAIYKNGVLYKVAEHRQARESFQWGNNNASVQLTAIVPANGTTDYFEIYGVITRTAGTVQGNGAYTYFSGSWLRN